MPLMSQKYFAIACCLFIFCTGCTSVTKKEDVFLQAREIKAAIASSQPPVPIVETPVAAVAPSPPTDNQMTELIDNERLVYKAKYLGITIGEFTTINHGKTTLNNREVYAFEVTVQTIPFFAEIFHAKDRYVSYLDTQKYVVLRHEEYIKKGTVLESSVDFDYDAHLARYKNYSNGHEKTVPIPEKIFDVISGGFYLRMLPSWELGDTVEFNVYADEKIYDYIGLLHSKILIQMPQKKSKVETYLFRPYAFLNKEPISNVSADIYLSTALPRKVLKGVLKTPFGNVSVVLSESNSKP